MSQHRKLAEGRWFEMSLAEQMAHIGSEVLRALSWKEKGNENHSRMALDRALELLDLQLQDSRYIHRLKEFCRLREVICDYFFGENEYKSTERQWNNYFYAFNRAARKNF
jgi:hypothetical protein